MTTKRALDWENKAEYHANQAQAEAAKLRTLSPQDAILMHAQLSIMYSNLVIAHVAVGTG